MTEAVELVTRHAFTAEADGGLGCHRVQIGASIGNIASRRVAERTGYQQVGHFRLDGRLGDGTYEDGVWFDQIAADRG